MQRVSLRNILAHRLRLALTLLAVVLGTAFIAGSFMFTSSLSQTFDSAVSNGFRDVDAVVSGKQLDVALRDQLAADPVVRAVNIRSAQTVITADKDAHAYQTGAGTSTVSPYYPPEQTVGPAATVVAGVAPAAPDEVVINKKAADKYGIQVGDTVTVVHPLKRDLVKVSGIYSNATDQAGIALLMDPTAFTHRYGPSQQLVIAAQPGTSAAALVEHLHEQYPDLQVESGQKLADDLSKAISDALQFVNYFLIAFGLIALLVGTFIIANTFAMIVAQRTKEFALLRALGATRGQITSSVVLEAFLVGLSGSAVGVLAGIGLVAIIKAVMNAYDMHLGDSLGVTLPAVLLPLGIGTLVTVISAWAPARRAGRVRPVEAMRTTESAAGSSLRVRTIFGGALLLLGSGLAVAGAVLDLATQQGAILVGVAALSLIVGFFLAGPALSIPVVPLLGRVIGAPFGSVGKLAATNSRRNPRRTAATAFALTLGIALVTAIGMLGATMQSSVHDTVKSQLKADYIVSAPSTAGFPTPADTLPRVKAVKGVEGVLPLAVAPVTVDGHASVSYGPKLQVSHMLEGKPAEFLNFTVVDGSLDFAEGFIATESFAQANGWKVGQSYPLAANAQSVGEITLQATFQDNHVVENMAVISPLVPEQLRQIQMVAVKGKGENLRADLEAAVKDLVIVQVMSSQEYAGQAASAISQMLAILYGLLSLAVIIAVLGIINTLTLGVIERRQEIGMLRAVGMQRRQIRTMITLEAVQIAIFGALAGVSIGFGLGWSFLKVLASSGLDKVTIPWELIGVMLVGSALVGVVAAIWPAARAAQTPPLDAIAD